MRRLFHLRSYPSLIKCRLHLLLKSFSVSEQISFSAIFHQYRISPVPQMTLYKHLALLIMIKNQLMLYLFRSSCLSQFPQVVSKERIVYLVFVAFKLGIFFRPHLLILSRMEFLCELLHLLESRIERDTLMKPRILKCYHL